MPNPFTGDSEAVLEVSQATFNRLLASMHQNSGGGTSQPALPHAAFLQLGGVDPHKSVDGVRGTVRAQLSVPRLHLIPGATDRTIVETWVRARFRPDPGSTAFPEFVYGVLQVQYAVVVEELRQKARYSTALRLVIDPDQVFFKSAGPDTSQDAAITRQIVALLQTTFVMTPHPLLNEFGQRRLKSLVTPAGGAVASIVSLSGAPTSGDLSLINEMFLAGKDFALAINRDVILSMLGPTLDAVRASQPKFSVSVKASKWLGGRTVSGTYTVSVTNATADWAPGTMTLAGTTSPAGVITLRISGSATTPSWLPNASFDLTHDLWIGFDAATESLFIMSSGAPSVSAHVNGPFGGLLEGYVQSAATSVYNAQLGPALAQAQLTLQGSATRKQTMVTQLQLIDVQADAHFDGAEFRAEGIILRGVISVSPRSVMQVTFTPQANQSGFTAYRSWIPGGRIDKFDWRWFWFDAASGPFGGSATPDQTQSHTDRFALQTNVSLPGLPPVAGDPGPGWPQMAGAVCLSIRGVCVNDTTGVEDAVDSSALYQRERMCLYFYPDPPPPVVVGGVEVTPLPKLWWKIWLTHTTLPRMALRELAILEVGSGSSSSLPVNHLVHYVDDAAAIETLPRLGEALQAAARDDAGLLITVVFREDLLERGGVKLGARLDSLTRSIGAPVIVTEDVRNGWSQRLGLPVGRGGAATRLITADQRVAWKSDGAPETAALAAALREHLVPCGPPKFVAVEPAVGVGEPAPVFDILTGAAHGLRLDRLGGNEIILLFVQPWSTPSLAQLRHLQRVHERLDRRGAVVVAVVSGDTYDDVERLVREQQLTYLVSLDPHGAIASRYGVRAWPTMITIDQFGLVSASQAGTDPTALYTLLQTDRSAAEAG